MKLFWDLSIHNLYIYTPEGPNQCIKWRHQHTHIWCIIFTDSGIVLERCGDFGQFSENNKVKKQNKNKQDIGRIFQKRILIRSRPKWMRPFGMCRWENTGVGQIWCALNELQQFNSLYNFILSAVFSFWMENIYRCGSILVLECCHEGGKLIQTLMQNYKIFFPLK